MFSVQQGATLSIDIRGHVGQPWGQVSCPYRQLAHAVRDPNGRAYNRTAHLPAGRKMMQQWADYLDKLKAGAEIIPINQTA